MNSQTMQGVFLDVPSADRNLLETLARKFGWRIRTREDKLQDFVKRRPKKPELTEEDIVNEIKMMRQRK